MIVTIFGYGARHHQATKDITSGPLETADDALDWIAATAGVDRRSLRYRGSEIWVAGACAVLARVESDTDTASDPLQGYSPDEIVVGAGWQTLAQAAEAEDTADAGR